ncbi:hypothetical protein AVEN_97227-1 [Araneus ventricosus]|uniref:Uncharacterized protein n=1 Tax=Araneus ventricosus TaxID=182803 RepID=A0A4Y2GB41_ARAVE|nr:hypothetical protein AVEN_97227-1 [Araneus ventricosus]
MSKHGQSIHYRGVERKKSPLPLCRTLSGPIGLRQEGTEHQTLHVGSYAKCIKDRPLFQEEEGISREVGLGLRMRVYEELTPLVRLEVKTFRTEIVRPAFTARRPECLIVSLRIQDSPDESGRMVTLHMEGEYLHGCIHLLHQNSTDEYRGGTLSGQSTSCCRIPLRHYHCSTLCTAQG